MRSYLEWEKDFRDYTFNCKNTNQISRIYLTTKLQKNTKYFIAILTPHTPKLRETTNNTNSTNKVFCFSKSQPLNPKF